MSANTKLPYTVVFPTAQRLVAALRPYCDRIEIAGSLRRQRPAIGDIELVALPRPRLNLFGEDIKGPNPLEVFLADKGIQFTKYGDRYKQFQYGRHTVDLFLPTPATWGSIFTIRTGSWQFSKWLVTPQAAGGAAPESVTFNGGRLHAHGRRLATAEEIDVFHALGLAYIDPADRHGPMPDAPRIAPVWNFEEAPAPAA